VSTIRDEEWKAIRALYVSAFKVVLKIKERISESRGGKGGTAVSLGWLIDGPLLERPFQFTCAVTRFDSPDSFPAVSDAVTHTSHVPLGRVKKQESGLPGYDLTHGIVSGSIIQKGPDFNVSEFPIRWA
jgi:hypothetical protein